MALAEASSSTTYSVEWWITGGDSSRARSSELQPRRTDGPSPRLPAENLVRAAENPALAHSNVSAAFFFRTWAGVVVVGAVNDRLGCETLPGLCNRTYATTPPTASNSSATAA